MKELYSFEVKRQVEKEVPYVKKTKAGPVETTKKVKKTIKNRVVFGKPSISDLEDAEFFYGQKYNEFINAGFLTKAMLAKKMGDLGGITSKRSDEAMTELVSENIEAARVIEFYSGAKDLDEEQKELVKESRAKFISTNKAIHEFEVSLRAQFNQTADAKAEQKLIEWLVLSFSFYEDEIKSKEKKDLFPIFEGENYDEKRVFLLSLQEKDEDIEDPNLLRSQNLFNSSFETLIRVASIWYNKLGDNQEDIEKSLKELFSPDEDLPDEE
tara:strand:- start:609 stop:1415 length:807 start_codon:yes stop_codon:yes gene_type:complete